MSVPCKEDLQCKYERKPHSDLVAGQEQVAREKVRRRLTLLIVGVEEQQNCSMLLLKIHR